MISGEAIIEASATIAVGLIFLVSLREALRLPTHAGFLDYMTNAMAIFLISILFVLLGEDQFFSVILCIGVPPPCPAPSAPWILGFLGRVSFLLGISYLIIVIHKIQGEAEKRERFVAGVRALIEWRSDPQATDEERELLGDVMERLKKRVGPEKRKLIEALEAPLSSRADS